MAQAMSSKGSQQAMTLFTTPQCNGRVVGIRVAGRNIDNRAHPQSSAVSWFSSHGPKTLRKITHPAKDRGGFVNYLLPPQAWRLFNPPSNEALGESNPFEKTASLTICHPWDHCSQDRMFCL